MTSMVVPSAGVSEGPNILVKFYDTVNAVKVHKGQMSDLSHQCNLLLSTVREYSGRLVEAEAGTIVSEADEIERAIERIRNRISRWGKLSSRAAFLRQNQIQIGIEQCYRDLSACTVRFMVASSMVQNNESQERERERQRNHEQLVGVIATLREEVRKLHSMPLEAAQSREQLLLPQVVDVDGQLALGAVPQGAAPQGAAPQVMLSPRPRTADHSGKVSRVSEDVVIEGSQLLFYIGEWTSDGERTALGRLRDQSLESQKRFKEWIEASLGLQHRNVLNFGGHVTINDVVYSVNPNPWLEHGNIREYLRRNPGADRVRLLSEVASGVEFFHEREILHGDLCDKNILINRDGKAIVCGFDLSEFSKTAISRARWLAPEQITSASVAAPTEKADIWSFGLLCLEVFTGKDPYHGHSDYYVPVLLSQGTHPEHPGSTAVGLSQRMWELMKSCWQSSPAQRPSMSEIHSTIRDMLPPRDGRQPFTENVDIPVPSLFTPAPAIDVSPPNDVMHSTVETSSPLSFLPLELTGIPPPHELNRVASTGFLEIVGQQTDTQAPNRRRIASDTPSSGSRVLTPLPEERPNPEIQVRHPPRSTTRPARDPPRPSTAPDTPTPTPLSRVDSSSSRSTSSANGTSTLRRLFGNRRTRTSPTSPGMDSDPSLSSSSISSHRPGPPLANPPSPSRTRTTPISPPSRTWTTPTNPPPSRTRPTPPPIITTNPPSPRRTRTTPTREGTLAARQPSRMSTTSSIDLPTTRNWDLVNPVVLTSMEMAASDTESILWPAIDGSVSAGNLEGLVSRVIADILDLSKDDHFRSTFLTIYQLFATNERLIDILKRRFESSGLDPVAARSRYPILLFIESWLKKGFADEDLKCTSMIKELVLPLVGSDISSDKMEAKAKEILHLLEDDDYILLRQPKNCAALQSETPGRPQGMTPADLAAALTAVEGDRFKCITYWDYVNFTRRRSNVRRIEVFNIVHDLVKVWVQTTVLESDFLEERMEKYEEWINTAKECRKLNNFSSTSAIVLALMSPLVKALALTCESKAKSDLYDIARELTPTNGAYDITLQRVATDDLIPWLDLHLSILNSSFAHSNPIVEVDGHPLIDFKHCSTIAEEIDILVQYSPPRTHHTTRSDVMTYVEARLKSSRGANVLPNAEKRSARLAEEERVFHAQRKKMIGLGFPWSPPRRRK